MGLTGVALNLVIGRYYGPADLGLFNQVYAVYIVSSQFAVFGLWFSTLKYVSQYTGQPELQSAIIVSALVLVVCIASVVIVCTFFLLGPIGSFFSSSNVAKGCLYALPGLWGYSFNKVLLAVLNGNRDMKAFAGFQMLRYFIMILTLLWCVFGEVPGVQLSLVLSVPEFFLFWGLLYYSKRYYSFIPLQKWKKYLSVHLWFGARSFLSGTVAELNTRVDVIMIGYFSSDYMVGIYSMAALVAEGVSQLSVVVRDNINPLLAQYVARGEKEKLQSLITRSKRWFYLAMGLVLCTSVLFFPRFVISLTGGHLFDQSLGVYIILVLGLALVAGYLPLNMILVQAGHPGQHTLLKCIVVVGNVGLNAILIPLWGIYGAALATSLSVIIAMFCLKQITRKVLGVSL